MSGISFQEAISPAEFIQGYSKQVSSWLRVPLTLITRWISWARHQVRENVQIACQPTHKLSVHAAPD